MINVHHFADQILDFLQANHNFGVDIHISDETEELLDTGGGLEKAGKYFISPCHEDKNGILLHNVDYFIQLQFTRFNPLPPTNP